MRQLTLDQPYRYSDLMNDIDYLKRTYPNLVQVINLGYSHDGRMIPMLVIGHGRYPIIITAGVHGRETINPMVLMRLVESYLELYVHQEPVVVDFGIRERLRPDTIANRRVISQPFYEMDDCTVEQAVGRYTPIGQPSMQPSNPQPQQEERFQTADKNPKIPSEYHIKNYFDTFTFYIVPLVNPDGYEIALGGFETIQNPELRKAAIESGIPESEWKANARGVDINRNFPSKTWKPKFPGDQPASENETQALIRLFQTVPAIGYLDLHSRGKAIYHHKGVMSDEYNQRQKAIASRLAAVTGYELMPPESEIEDQDSGGNTVHYFSENFGNPAITIETVTDMETFPLDVRHQTPTFNELYLAPLEFGAALLEE